VKLGQNLVVLWKYETFAIERAADIIDKTSEAEEVRKVVGAGDEAEIETTVNLFKKSGEGAEVGGKSVDEAELGSGKMNDGDVVEEITKAQDAKDLSTLKDVYDGLRLDYDRTPFNLALDKDYGIIRFKTDAVDKIDIPYGPSMEEIGAKPPANGFDTSPDPFTGHGFTKDINGNIIPKYTMQYLKTNEGAEVYRVNSETGTEELIAKFINGTFVKIK
jgi:hypothetical protein